MVRSSLKILFAADPQRANEKYGNKYGYVDGEIAEIERMENGNIVYRLKGVNNITIECLMDCTFRDARKLIESAKKGQKVKVFGLLSLLGGISLGRGALLEIK